MRRVPVHVLVLRVAGTNCDRETAVAFRRAGADEVSILHLSAVVGDPAGLDPYRILVLPGGFSYGDDIAAGRVLAVELQARLGDGLHRFVQRGGLVLGICNGFQVLVKTGLLPGRPTDAGRQTVTLSDNDCGLFVDRWVTVERDPGCSCVWTRQAPARLEMPVAHAEGKFIAPPAHLEELESEGLAALRYAAPGGGPVPFPHNPNGSLRDIAGLTDPSGRVLGLMPHPERHMIAEQHPAWTRDGREGDGDGLALLRSGVEGARELA